MAHVFFDLDGTLTDSAPGITRCLRHAVLEVGGDAPDLAELPHFIGTPLVEIFRTLLPGREDETIRAAIAAYVERFDRIGIRENAVFPGIEKLLGDLRGDGHTLYVATAKLTQTGREVIDLFSLDHHFAEIHGSPGGPHPVEKHEILRSAMEQHGLEPHGIVMVGDRHYDVQAAKTLGAASIAVDWGYAKAQELEASAPHAIAKRPEEIPAILQGLAD